MSDEVQALTVPVDTMVDATAPLVVISAELLTNINTLGQQVASLSVISTDAENEVAGNLLKVITSLEKDVEDSRKKLGDPYRKVVDAVNAEAGKASKPLATLKATLKASLGAFVVKREKERLAAEQEAARKRAEEAAEVARLNAEREAAALAAGGPPPTPLAPAPSQVILTKPPVAQASATKIQKKMVVILTDPDKVPRAYCIPDLKLIEDAWKRGELVPEFHPFFRVEEQVNVSAK